MMSEIIVTDLIILVLVALIVALVEKRRRKV